MKPSSQRIVYPPESNVVVDVTKAPYFLDNTGTRDCTAALVGILDELGRKSLDGMARVMQRLQTETAPNFRFANSFENRRQDGIIFGVFPDPKPPGIIIYFPKGTYLITDTVCYSLDNLRNGLGTEMNWHMRMVGESRDETILKLQDHCKGFEYGMYRPAVSFIRGDASNIAMTNFFRNLTIDIGKGNPGAIGLEFFGNNCAGVRDVTIRSSDPDLRGQAGISISHNSSAAFMFRNIEIEGFDIGMQVHAGTYFVCENIHLKNQANRGISADKSAVISIRNLFSENKMPALSVRGHSSHVVLIDAVLSGGLPDAPSVEHIDGMLFLRNIQTSSYRCALGMTYSSGWGTDPVIEDKNIVEHATGSICTLSNNQSPRSLDLEIQDAPEFEWDLDFDHWIHPGIFDAIGDGIADDTAAIQKAMDSGKPVIYFQQGKYKVDAPIRIPASVRRINFMFVDFVAGENLKKMANKGMFTVAGESPEPLLLEDVFSFEENHGLHYFVDHASTRTLVMRDLHLQACAAYRNSVPGGKVFIENVVTTTGVLDETYNHPCFVFTGQQAWCRQLDPEYTPDKIINDGSTLYIMGFKTEGHGIAFTTKNGGRTEILGGILLFGGNNDVPIVLNDESDVAFIASTLGTTRQHLFKIAVKEIINGETRQAEHHQFPPRMPNQYFIPLYVGRKGAR